MIVGIISNLVTAIFPAQRRNSIFFSQKNKLSPFFSFPDHYSSLIPYSSGPQPFWCQGPVSWKTIFPWTAWGGGMDGCFRRECERWGAADEAPLARPLLTSCCAARFLTGRRLVVVRGPGVGDPCLIGHELQTPCHPGWPLLLSPLVYQCNLLKLSTQK